MQILNKLHGNIHAVNNIRIMTLSDLHSIVRPHLHDSGYVKTNEKGERDGHIQLVTFGEYPDDTPISFHNKDLNLDCEGFTEDGMIIDSYCAIVVLDYEDMTFEQTAWALEIALKQFGDV